MVAGPLSREHKDSFSKNILPFAMTLFSFPPSRSSKMALPPPTSHPSSQDVGARVKFLVALGMALRLVEDQTLGLLSRKRCHPTKTRGVSMIDSAYPLTHKMITPAKLSEITVLAKIYDLHMQVLEKD